MKGLQMVTKNDEVYFTLWKNRIKPPEVAKLLKRTVKTLAYWRTKGLGPSYEKLGGKIYYNKQDIEEWIKQQYVTLIRPSL